MKTMFHYLNRFSTALRKDALLRQYLLRNSWLLLKALLRIYLSPKYSKLIIISLSEHIGDIVASEPFAYHLRKLNPRAFIIWLVDEKYEELVKYNTNINAVLKASCLTELIILKKVFSRFIKFYDLHVNMKTCTTHRISNRNSINKTIDFSNYLNHGNLLQIGSMAAGINDMPDYAPKFFFKDNQRSRLIEADYIVLHTLSNNAERNWCSEKWNDLVKRLLIKYPEIHIAEIGLENIIQSRSPRYYNFTGKLSLQEIAGVIEASVLFIGVESGFGHIANALSKNSIILIGYYRGFKNYMVYSGAFARGENVSLLYYQGNLKHLEVDEVERAVDKRISISSIFTAALLEPMNIELITALGICH